MNWPSLTREEYYSKSCFVQVGPSYGQELVAASLALGLSPLSRSPGPKWLWAKQSPRHNILQRADQSTLYLAFVGESSWRELRASRDLRRRWGAGCWQPRAGWQLWGNLLVPVPSGHVLVAAAGAEILGAEGK